MRLEIAYDDVFYYPDVVVSCDPADRQRYYLTHPKVIAEVMSETSERFDGREKFLSYIRLPSMMEYLLIHQDQPLLTLFRRATDWRPEALRPGDELLLPSLDFHAPVAAILEGVEFNTGG